jgi:hypothetical protein
VSIISPFLLLLTYAPTSLHVGGWRDRWENWAAEEDWKMTIRGVVEVVIVVIMIYFAVRFFLKRG